MRLIFGHAPPLEFVNPHARLFATTVDGAMDALREAEGALRDGYWIAGTLAYELGAALHGVSHSHGPAPLLRLGVFDAPVPQGPRTAGAHAVLSPLLPRVNRAAYAAAIETIKRAIYDGDVYQVNYTVPFDVCIDGSAEALWHTIAATTGAEYQAYFEDGDDRVLSWSPELFLRFDGTRVEARPMKGTALPGMAHELRDSKNRAEHIMIADLLCNDLRRIATDVAVESLMTLERYPTFLTLTSTIAGTISEGVRLEDIVRATFPCGSVTGAPKRSAMEYIARCEPDPRGTYCGSIGFLSPRRTGVWNVAIRTMQIRGTTGTFHAGGGIVADSDASSEWNEIAVKSSFLRAYTEPLELLEAFASNAAEEVVEAHLARLSASASVFGIPLDSAALRAHLTGVRATTAAHMIRLRVSADGAFRTATEPLVPVIEPVPICLAGARVRSNDPFLRHKTAWRPAARAAWETARAHGCFDAVLRNERDELTEGSRTNLYLELDGELWTPPVESGLLPGIGRSRIVTHGQARERVLTCDDLARADAVFVGNSARGILRATMVQTAQ